MHILHAFTPVLVTGATGLIGGEILRALIHAGMKQITATVRALPDSDISTRLLDRLRRSGDTICDEHSFHAVAGDVRKPLLGMPDSAAERVRREVEIIIHAASETSFIRGKNCYDTNVVGMRHLIEFASTCKRNPLIVYMSTAANSGAVTHRCLREDEGCQPDATHHNDYTHSKAIAEKMLWDSGLPALVLRPSIVFSAGMPDACFARAILWFVPLLYDFDAVPIDPESRIDAVPVSFVVDATMNLLRHPARRFNCYHLSGGRHSETSGALVEYLDGFYNVPEPLKMIRPDRWTREMHRRYVSTPNQRKIFSMLRHYLPFLNMDVVYDNSRLASDLGDAQVQVPPFSSYLGELVELIPHEAALAEALNP